MISGNNDNEKYKTLLNLCRSTRKMNRRMFYKKEVVDYKDELKRRNWIYEE